MKRTKRITLLLLAVTLLFPGVSLFAANPPNRVGTLASAPVLVTFDGQYQYLSKLFYQGEEKPRQPKSIVVLNFMGMNCSPCKKEMPIFLEVMRSAIEAGEKSGESIRFYMISIDPLSLKDELRLFFKEQKVDVDTEVLLDPYRKAAEKFSVGSIPRTFVISAGGLITADISGNVRDYRKRLINGINAAQSK